MRLAQVVVAAAMLLVLTRCSRSDGSLNEQERRHAFDYLMQREGVDSAHVGYVGSLSRDALALRVLLEADDAPDRFAELVQRAKIGGRLVGLCGLKLVASPKFETALESLAKQTGTVGGMQGCLLGGSRAIAVVLQDIEAGSICDEYAGTDEPEWLRAEYRKVRFAE